LEAWTRRQFPKLYGTKDPLPEGTSRRRVKISGVLCAGRPWPQQQSRSSRIRSNGKVKGNWHGPRGRECSAWRCRFRSSLAQLLNRFRLQGLDAYSSGVSRISDRVVNRDGDTSRSERRILLFRWFVAGGREGLLSRPGAGFQ